MAEFSSIMAIEINEAGQPTNLVAFSQGDKISNEVLNDDIVNGASGVSSVSSVFGDFSGNIQTCTVFVSGVVDNLEASTQNLSGILDGSTNFPNTSLEASTRNLSGILDGSTNFPNTDLEASTQNLSAILDGSTNFPNTAANNFQGSAIASALFIANGSSIAISGSEVQGDGTNPTIDNPANNMVLSIDTAEQKLKFRKVGRSMMEAGAIDASLIEAGAVGTSQLATGAASGNIVIGGLALNKLIPIAAGNFLGNPNSLGAPVEAVDKAAARNMLGVSAGTNAPPSPDEGDLWYDTTTDVDELFAYDSGRGKWLGVNSFAVNMGRTGTISANTGHFAIIDNREANTANKAGFIIPFNCTVVAWAFGTDNSTNGWNHRLSRYDDSAGSNNVSVHNYQPGGSYRTWSQLDVDVDFDQGDVMGISAVGSSTGSMDTANQYTVMLKRRTS